MVAEDPNKLSRSLIVDPPAVEFEGAESSKSMRERSFWVRELEPAPDNSAGIGFDAAA